MTMPHERTRAVLQTREFLKGLAGKEPGIPQAVRQEAERLLRHYPDELDLAITAKALPAWWSVQDS